MPQKPLIGLSACVRMIQPENLPFHIVGDKYARAVAISAEATPLVIPAMESLLDAQGLLESLDGLVFTGSTSNVHPTLYGKVEEKISEPYDAARDSTTLPLIRAAIAAKVPMFCICRGLQELNVALGGSLHPAVHELEGRRDHRVPQSGDLDFKYGPQHHVTFVEDGFFHNLWGQQGLDVNTLHWQAIDRLAPDLIAEGYAEDGTIEAVRLAKADFFCVGVQWHPEYKSWENPFSTQLFKVFGEAARERAVKRRAVSSEKSYARMLS